MLEILSKDSIMKEYTIKDICRYNHRCRIKDESVAEHTCFVSLFCLKIMSRLNLTVEQERKVLILAALHDTCESETSDIPHDVKVNYPKMQNILSEIEEEYYKDNWGKYYDNIYEKESVVNFILKLADAYSVYQWCLNEKELGNNMKSIDIIYNESFARIKHYTDLINKIL